MENSDTGFLLDKENIILQREYFAQMVEAVGLNVLYRTPIPGKTYNGYGELDAAYNPPVMVSCIYDEHPTQKTMKKLGWNAELADTSTVIQVPYDTPNLQAGCLFIIPSALDNAEARVFKVLRMSSIAIYPAFITCELGPVLINTTPSTETKDFSKSNFNLLDDDSEDFE